MAAPNLPARRAPRKRDLVSRVAAAVLGSYAVATTLSMLLARLLPWPKASATTAAILSGGPIYLCAVLWAFGAASPSRVWLVLGAVALASGMLDWGLISWEGH